MSEYTPTTEQVREAYSLDPYIDYYDPVNAGALHAQARRDFDRWLAAHDRETARKAWDEAADTYERDALIGWATDTPPSNPYKETTDEH